MMIKKLAFLGVVLGVVLGVLCCAPPVSAVEVAIDVTNLAPAGGVALSPFFIGAHNGSFDPFNAGAAAGLGIETVAELGDVAPLTAEFTASQPAGVSGVVTATSGGFGPGIFLPGGSGSIVLDLDPAIHRYLTYASMVVPSNDYFVGNDSPTSIELFDAMGNFTASSVVVTANQIWNAGTEIDNVAGGPAFVVGQDAMTGMPEGGLVSLDDNLSIFSGAATPAGYTFNSLPTGNAQIARLSLSVVPEPAGIVLALVGALAACLVVRRR
jgi:hypothetical protein